MSILGTEFGVRQMGWLIAVAAVLVLFAVAWILSNPCFEAYGRLRAAEEKKAEEDRKHYDEVQLPEWLARREAGLLPSEEEEDFLEKIEREEGYPIPIASPEGSRIEREVWRLRQEAHRLDDGWRFYIAVRVWWLAVVLGLATLFAGALWLLLTF
jgi:hypothetical protein